MAADQLELFSLPNPCIGVCESNRKGYCKGCLRSREERFNWHQKTLQEQRTILTKLAQRRARLMRRLPEPDEELEAGATWQADLFGHSDEQE